MTFEEGGVLFVLGVTGSFGAGKSTVAAMLARLGAVIIDADAIVHELLLADRKIQRDLCALFGPQIIGESGVNRARLGKIVFDDKLALQKLERVVHPALGRELRCRIRKINSGVVVLDAALLIETGWFRLADAVIVVRSRLNEQVARAQRRTGLARQDVLKRLRRQMSLREKLKYADFVIDNSGSRSETYRQVKKMLKRIPHKGQKELEDERAKRT